MRRHSAIQLFTDLTLLVAMTCLIGIGLLASNYVVGLFEIRSTSIYGAAFGHQFVIFPSLPEWIESAFSWPSILLSGIILTTSLHTSSPKSLFYRVLLSSLIIFLTIDSYNLVSSKNLSVSLVITAFTLNGLAALMLATTFICLIGAADWLFDEPSMNHQKLQSGLLICIIATSLLIVSYFGLRFFFGPITRDIEIVLGHPSHGYLFGRDESDSTENSTAAGQRITLIHELINKGVVNWRSAKKGIKVSWEGATPTTYDVVLTLYNGCFDAAQVPVGNGLGKSVVFAGIRKLDVWFDSGIWNFNIYGSKESDNLVSIVQDEPVINFSTSSGASGIEVTQFVDKSGTITYSGQGSMSFYALAMPYDVIQNQFVPVENTLHIVTDQRAQTIELSGPSSSNSDTLDPKKCMIINTPVALKSGTLDIKGASALVGLKVDVKIASDSPAVVDDKSVLTVSGESGWLTTEGVDVADLSRSKGGGDLKGFIVSNIASLDLDGSASPIRDSDNIDAYGDFHFNFTNEGKIRLIGQGKMIRKNNSRLNETQWEALSEGMQVAIASSLIVALGAMFALFRFSYKKNAIHLLSPVR